jgi:ribosomal protein S12 methylthiotransferase accessory factor YcaO
MRCIACMTCDDAKLLERAIKNLNGKFNVLELPMHDSPVFLAVAFPAQRSVTGIKPRLPAGRGFSRSQAMLSAVAEAGELLATLAMPHAVTAGENGTAKVPATRLSDGQSVEVSAQQVFLDWAAAHDEPLAHDADSTGCAAGQNLEDATTRALFECLERDALAIWWYGKQSRHHLPMSYMDTLHPRLAWWLDQRSRRTVFIDITSDLGVPTYAAVSCEPDGSGIAIGTAAGLQTSSTLLSATTEMIQMEASMEIGMTPANQELFNWRDLVLFDSMKQFAAIEGSARVRHLVGSVLTRMDATDFPILRVDLTQKEGVFSVVRMIVPGLCKMNRGINAERIVKNALHHPEYGGVLRESEFEVVEPY